MILDDIGMYLQGMGYGKLGETLFLQFKPDNKDCIVIWLTGGNPPRTDLNVDTYTIQVRIINKNFSVGYEKIKNIKNELHDKLLHLTSNVYAKAYTEITSWFEEERWSFVINFELTMRRL